MSTKKHTKDTAQSKKKKLKPGGVRKKGNTKGKSWSKDPFASLNPNKNMGRRLDDVYDVLEYADKLNQEEKLFLAKFMDEYNNAKLDYDNLENNLHNTKELKKACTDRNNARNRCIYTIEEAQGTLTLAGSDRELESIYYGSTEDNEEEATQE
jgi:hypothetical protein